MVAVRGDDAVLLGDGGLHADGDGLLPVVEVAEPPDQLGLVQGVGGDLGAAHQGHGAEEADQLLRGRLDGPGRGLASVGGEGHGGLDGDRRGVRGDRAAEEGGGNGGGEGLEEGGARRRRGCP